MDNPLLLGIDIGTSACKAALFTKAGEVVAQSGEGYPVAHPQPGWAEQEPTVWWAAVCRAVKALLAQNSIAPGRIAGVGVDGQSWSAIPLARDGTVLCPTPIWMDTRAASICRELSTRLGEALFAASGNPLQPSYSLPKVLWYKEHRPDLYRRTDKILQSNSYIVYRLTGAVTQDLSQAYGYQCFDMAHARWDDALCAELGLRRSLLPEPVACHALVGTVTAQASRECGLLPGTPVVAGGLDAACGTLGAGVLDAGQTQEQGGQAGGMSICMDRFQADPRLILSLHVVPGRWLLQGGTVGGGGVVRWFEEQLGAAERESAKQNGTGSLCELDKLAQAIPPGAQGLVFLPYMAGERSPLWNPDAKGVYYGLDYSKTRGHMIRAALEGVAFALRHNLAVAQQAGARVERLRAMGGAANSRLWTQIKCDVTQTPIDVPSSDTATTLGAALLAGVAVGLYSDFSAAVASTVRVTRTHLPCEETRAVYDESYQLYRKLYEQLSPLMMHNEQPGLS